MSNRDMRAERRSAPVIQLKSATFRMRMDGAMVRGRGPAGVKLFEGEGGRCGWANPADSVYVAYHDEEWGVPEHDSRALWEKLVLDGFQAGLAWITIPVFYTHLTLPTT